VAKGDRGRDRRRALEGHDRRADGALLRRLPSPPAPTSRETAPERRRRPSSRPAAVAEGSESE
jgi:hypothetical protein